MDTTVEDPRAQIWALPDTYDALVALPKQRSDTVRALVLGSGTIPTGTIVYANKLVTAELYEPGIRECAWGQLSPELKISAQEGQIEARAALMVQYKAYIKRDREKLYKHLKALSNQPIGIGKTTFTATRDAYEAVLKEIVSEIIDANKTTKILPQCAIDALNEGKITVVEDLEVFIRENYLDFFKEVYDTEGAALGLLDRAERDELFHLSVNYVEEKFDQAQRRFLTRLAVSLNGKGDIESLEEKLKQRQAEASDQITKVVKIITDLQIQMPGLREVNMCTVMSDLKTKSIWQLVEIVFYEHSYGVGKVRKYWAQLILVLTELLHSIREDPHYKNAGELTNKLNSIITTRALATDPGRRGEPVEGLFIDAGSNYFQESAPDRMPVTGVQALKLKPRESVFVDQGGISGKRDLFPNGLWVICNSRAKNLVEISRKCWDRGVIPVREMNDLAGLQFVILPQQFIEEYQRDHGGQSPSKEWLEQRLAQAAIELEYYLRDLWGVKELCEKAIHQIGTTNQGSAVNSATAATYQENKFVFSRNVNGVNVRAEAQILTLETYLKVISKDTPESHTQYGKRRLVAKILSAFLPAEVWPGFVENLQRELSANRQTEDALVAELAAA